MDATDLDEDFVNFEAVSQTCSSSTLDEELSLLDNEARQRERNGKDGDKEAEDLEEDERNNNGPGRKMKGCGDGGEAPSQARSEEHLFAAFAYNTTSKRLTMIPVKYKMKEERRKVLKISINKLKKIDDPESWLCRSVLINNTMKKLQKEARDEKMQKQMSAYTKNYLLKSQANLEPDDFPCQLNNNNRMNGESCPLKMDDQDCFYQKEFIQKEKEDVFCQLSNSKDEYEFHGLDKGKESVSALSEEEDEDRASRLADESSISNGVPLNEDFVEKIPSIKRCASRKRSLDEDGTASEILNLDEAELEAEASKRPRTEPDEVDECDVHDVLSQLYMPPTPRMLTSIDSDTDEDDLNVVDIDSSYIDEMKAECQNKLPSGGGEEEEEEEEETAAAVAAAAAAAAVAAEEDGGLFDAHLLGGKSSRGCKRKLGHEDVGGGVGGVGGEDNGFRDKRKMTDDIFSCFGVCEAGFLAGDPTKKDNLDNFLYNSKGKDKDRTSGGESCGRSEGKAKGGEEDELIELEDEEDIKRRLSQSLSSHYQRKSDKSCDSFFDDNCDNQYSCGHTVNMFNDIQSVTFHNLIASLET